MPKTIQQSVTLPARAAELYRMYLDSRRHALITGAPVKIRAKPGSSFRAFNGALSGRMLFTRPGRMIIQTWRSTGFGPKDLDSTLILTFWPRGESGRIQLVHVNVADRDARGVTEGWKRYYWKPWRAYLKKKKKRRGRVMRRGRVKRPAPDLNIDAHDAPGSWFQEMRTRGFVIPVQLARGLSHAMRALRVPFPEAFRLLWGHRKIWREGRVLIYDLSAPVLWQREET